MVLIAIALISILVTSLDSIIIKYIVVFIGYTIFFLENRPSHLKTIARIKRQKNTIAGF